MGFFSGLDTEAYDRQYDDRTLIVRMMAYFQPHLRRLTAVSLLVILLALSGAALPILVARGVDALATSMSAHLMWLLASAVLLTGIINWGANWIRRRLTQRIVGDVILQLRADAFEAAAHHDLSFYDRFSSGRIVSRITSDTNEFGQVVVLVTDLVAQLVQALILAVVLVRTEWRLALLLFVFLPVVFAFAVGFRSLARRVTRRGMQAMANVNAAIKETVSGIAVAKNFRQEAGIYAEFDDANRASYRVNVQRGFVLSLVFPTLNALSGVGTAILLYAGGRQVAMGAVSVGAWYLFLSSLDRFWFPILNLSAFWAQIQSGLSASERVFALMDADAAVQQVDSQPVESLRGEITFENVHFRYADKEPVLQGFTLHIRAGESLALVGHTGAGKSSIARLIARFYEFQSGRILVDGRDIRTLDLISYRRHLGIVSQVPFLFSGTVIENIRYACPQADVQEITALARQIGDGEWLEALPDGLQTEVGERGARLSMGQRQLVALLRVLVQKPAIFILDEATASIDPFTEWQIQQALDMILRNTTSILIAHRLSTVKAADRILVLQQGAIIEEGTHDTLLTRGGHYATLYNTYFRHQSLQYVEQQRKRLRD
ncbi:MAG: ABC transporter ATP-binding protein [Anaerolineae bacterium]|nr:MAG: ABC transporter ATP-binding protein [Anaerolineae bacterium]